MPILFPDPVIWAPFVSEIIYEHKNSSGLIIESIFLFFGAKNQLKPLSMKFHIHGFEVSGTQF